MLYREAIKFGFFNFQNIRDRYRDAVKLENMHRDSIDMFCRLQALIVSPIAPHFAEHVWKHVMKAGPTIIKERWPQLPVVDAKYVASGTYLTTLCRNIRSSMSTEQTMRRKKKQSEAINSVEIYVARSYPEWQSKCIDLLTEHYDSSANAFKDEAHIVKKALSDAVIKKATKKAIPFLKELQVSTEVGALSGF